MIKNTNSICVLGKEQLATDRHCVIQDNAVPFLIEFKNINVMVSNALK